VDKLTPVTGGQFVVRPAGETNGKVGPIGGVQQKMVSARNNNVTVFLTPAAGPTRSAPAGLRLIKVRSLSGAL
jgi:PDZ domain-containing protein